MLFVAQAVVPCTTAGLPRLGGGAVLIRPVTDAEPVPFLPLGPTTSVRVKRESVQQVAAPDEQSAPDQCEAAISIA